MISLGLGQLDMAAQEGQAGGGFLRRGIAIVGRAPVDDIGDVGVDVAGPARCDASILSSSWPARPTKGLPMRSSSRPGASPISITRPSATPSAKTVLVAVRFRAQPSKASSAAFSSARLVAAPAAGLALPMASSPSTWGPKGGGVARAGASRTRLEGAALIARRRVRVPREGQGCARDQPVHGRIGDGLVGAGLHQPVQGCERVIHGPAILGFRPGPLPVRKDLTTRRIMPAPQETAPP